MKLLLILSICSSAFQSLSFVTKSVNCWSIASNSFHERATALHSSVDQASANFDPFSQSLGELSSAAGDVTKELSLSDEVADAGVGDLLGAKLFSDDTVAEALSPLLETVSTSSMALELKLTSKDILTRSTESDCGCWCYFPGIFNHGCTDHATLWT